MTALDALEVSSGPLNCVVCVFSGSCRCLQAVDNVDGLKLPFRIRRVAGSETTEETIFDRYRINAKVDPRRFDTK